MRLVNLPMVPISNVPGVGVLRFDAASGTLIDANDAFLEMFGYTREDVASGKLTWRTMTPIEHVPESEAQMAAFQRTGRIGPYEKEYLRKNGTRSWMVFAGAAVGDGTVIEHCIDVSDRKRAEAELRRAHDALAEANRRLRDEAKERELSEAARDELLQRLASAHERQRLARELHDSVGQILAVLTLSIQAVATAGPLPPLAVERLAEVQRVADLLGRELHGLAVRLRPTSLEEIGLDSALAQLVSEWSTQTGVPVDTQTTGLRGLALEHEVETTVFRVVQEALTNVGRHAHAKQVSVIVSPFRDVVTAIVEDDGVGFDPGAAHGGRLGLVGMRERVVQLGGELEIESAPGKGTTVIARIPFAQKGRSGA